MRNPLYKFYLEVGGETPSTPVQVYPIYKELKIEASKEDGHQFFRKKLTGNLTFVRNDYNYINSKAFDTEFLLDVYQSLDNGQTWQMLIQAKFFKTDCKWNAVDKVVQVTPQRKDQYDNILKNLDKEFDIIKLTPQIEQVQVLRSPAVQIYRLGTDVMGYYHNGLYWEVECTNVEDETELTDTYHFEKTGHFVAGTIKVEGYPQYDCEYNGIVGDNTTTTLNSSNDKVTIEYRKADTGDYIAVISNSRDLWYYNFSRNVWGIKDAVYLDIRVVPSTAPDMSVVYSRALLATNVNNSYPIPTDDIVDDNRNYRYCIPFASGIANNVVLCTKLSDTPTKYGLANDTQYFDVPDTDNVYFPIAKSGWISSSLWFKGINGNIFSTSYSQRYTLKHAYPLSSVLDVLIKQVGNYTHEKSVAYSQFLYNGNNPVNNQALNLYITPKSNLLHGDYDIPAQTCKTTIGTILNALRDMFRIFWYITDDGKLVLEHEKFFRNGYSYTTNTNVGVDLTTLLTKRDGKAWAFAQGEYSYDKASMPAKYQFGWMDEVSDAFDTDGVDIKSGYVSETQTESVSCNSITTDIDYIMLCPSDVSQDGMIMMSTIKNAYNVQQVNDMVYRVNGLTTQVQNGFLSWHNLVLNYYKYAFPSTNVKFEGSTISNVLPTQNRNQTLKFPYVEGFDEKKLIKTLIGYANIEKYTLSLQTLQLETNLIYDNE